MKAKSDITNDKPAEWGFKKVSDGYHIIELGEGAGLMVYTKDGENKAGESHKAGDLIMDKKGNKQWKFPAKVNDENDEDNGADISGLTASETEFGEKKIADILAAIGEFKKFEEKFPGDRSFFEEAIINQVIIRTQHKFLKVRTETSKDGQFTNVVEVASVKYNPADSKKDKAAAKAEGKAGKEKAAEIKTAAAGAGASDGWD